MHTVYCTYMNLSMCMHVCIATGSGQSGYSGQIALGHAGHSGHDSSKNPDL